MTREALLRNGLRVSSGRRVPAVRVLEEKQAQRVRDHHPALPRALWQSPGQLKPRASAHLTCDRMSSFVGPKNKAKALTRPSPYPTRATPGQFVSKLLSTPQDRPLRLQGQDCPPRLWTCPGSGLAPSSCPHLCPALRRKSGGAWQDRLAPNPPKDTWG